MKRFMIMSTITRKDMKNCIRICATKEKLDSLAMGVKNALIR